MTVRIEKGKLRRYFEFDSREEENACEATISETGGPRKVYEKLNSPE